MFRIWAKSFNARRYDAQAKINVFSQLTLLSNNSISASYFSTSLVLNHILFENIIWKKVVYTIEFYLQFLCVAGYLKHINNTPKLNIHKYTNYNIIQICINRLSTTTQNFIAMDYLIMISEKHLYFRKRKDHFRMDIFFAPCRSTWIHVLWQYFLNYVFLKDMHNNLKKNWNNSSCFKVNNFERC